MRFWIFAAAATAVPGLAFSAEAAPADFVRCDGYAASNLRGDGMTGRPEDLAELVGPGRGQGNTNPKDAQRTGQGIEACTRALEDEMLRPQYRLRRANLLRARALHRLANGSVAEALIDLDLSEQAMGPMGPLGARSLGLGTQLVRGYARLLSGDRDAAAQAARTLISARPFEPELGIAAAKLHLAATRDWDVYSSDLRTLARVDPNLILSLYFLDIQRGRFDDLIDLHPHIFLVTPVERGGYQIEGYRDIPARNLVTRLLVDGALAFALATRGDFDRAREVLDAARRSMQAELAPPTAPAGQDGPTDLQRAQHAAMLARKSEAETVWAEWDRLVRLRRMIADGEIDAAISDIQGSPPGRSAMMGEVLGALVRARPTLAPELEPVLARSQSEDQADLDRMAELDLASLIRFLPEPETTGRLPAYDGGSEGFWSMDYNGYRTHRGPIEGAQTIRFASQNGTTAIANEMALLRAAELARRSGRRGLLILGRRGMVRTTIVTSNYGATRRQHASGQEAELDVVFVDPEQLPEEYSGGGWRVVDAETVWSTLAPIYTAQRPRRR